MDLLFGLCSVDFQTLLSFLFSWIILSLKYQYHSFWLCCFQPGLLLGDHEDIVAGLKVKVASVFSQIPLA